MKNLSKPMERAEKAQNLGPHAFPISFQNYTKAAHHKAISCAIPLECLRALTPAPLADPYSAFTHTTSPVPQWGHPALNVLSHWEQRHSRSCPPQDGKRAGKKWREKNAALDDGSPRWPGQHQRTISSSQGKGCRSVQPPSRQEKKVQWKQWMCGAGQVKYLRRGRRGQAWRGYTETEGAGVRADGKCWARPWQNSCCSAISCVMPERARL